MSKTMAIEIRRCRNRQHIGPSWFRFHTTSAARLACDQVQRDADSEDRERARERAGRPIVDRIQQDFQRQKPSAAQLEAEAEPTGAPGTRVERLMLRAGERQLSMAARDSLALAAIDQAAAGGIYGINSMLRAGGDLSRAAPSIAEKDGFESMSQVVDCLDRVFDLVGPDLRLSETMTVYRGVGVSDRETSFGDGDFWDLRACIDGRGLAPQDALVDRGFMFASPSVDDAKKHSGPYSGGLGGMELVLLELRIDRGLCLPAPEHRSRSLKRLLCAQTFLPAANAQVIIGRDSRWRVRSATPPSDDEPARVVLDQL